MGLSDLYYKLEEKYYSSLDWLDSKGLHFFYKIDEWLNSKNIPSFPVVAIGSVLLIIVLVLLILLAAGVFTTNTVSVTFKFIDATNNATVPDLSVNFSYGSELVPEITNASGIIKINVPKDELVQINIDSEKYILDQSSFTFSETTQQELKLNDKSSLLGSKTLKLFTDLDTGALFSDIVELDLVCSNNANYIKKKIVVNGVIDLADLPDDCGQLTISSLNPEINKTITVGVDSLDVLIGEDSYAKGTLRVIAQDEKGNVLKNIDVTVYTEDNFYSAGSVTTETGLTEFNLKLGKYYVNLSDPANEYSIISTKDSIEPGCFDTLQQDVPTVCTVTMKQSNVGKIKLMILDISGKPVKEAQVKIYKGEIEILDKLMQDMNGLYTKGMPEQGPYRVVIDSPQYMIYDNSNIYVSDVPLEVHLEPVKESPVLKVYVTANNEPVALASVQLMKEGNLILTKTTGADGIAYFDRLESNKVYSAKVVKGDYSQTSGTITLDPRAENKLNVEMVIGKGNVDVEVFDKDELPTTASVELYNAFTDKVLATSQTDVLGVAHFYGVSADKTVYAKVNGNYSLPKDISSNNTVSLQVYNLQESGNLNLDLIGVYNLDGSKVSTMPYDVVTGSEYYALFNLSVPKGKPFTQGEVFFVGDAKTASESSILFKNLELLNANVTKGITYNAPLGYAEDMLNKTSDDSLWVDAKLTKVNAGNNLVKVSFIVSNEPKTDLFKVGYRANLKSGSAILRYPVDTQLSQNENVTEKLGFYADTQGLSFKAGDLICSDNACIEMNAQDSLGNKTRVIDNINSIYNSITSMSFSIVPAGKVAYKNVTLEIGAKNSGLTLSNVAVLLNGKTVSVEGKGKYSALLPTFTTTSDIEGNLGFVANKVGDTILTITLLSEKKEVIFTKDIIVSVDSAKNLVVEYLPSVIVPYVVNLGAIVVNDATEKLPVSDAIISVYLNDILIKSDKTDLEGKIPLQIDNPNVGDTLKIVASAPGYNNNETSVKITENILVPDKADVSIYLDPMENENSNIDLLLKTPLPYKMKVSKISFSTNDFSDLVELKVGSISSNQTFDGNLDLNINAQLTKLGKSVLEPKTFTTNLEILVRADEINKSWLVKVPINVNIRLADSLDSSNCLAMTVENLGVTNNVKVVNNCLYKSKNVNLYNATLFVEWDGQILGTYSLNKDKVLDDGLVVLQTVKPKTNTFSLAFTQNPAIVSGQAKVNFVLKAYYPTNTALQEVTANKEFAASVSDYTKCLQVISSSGQILNADTVASSPIVLGITQYGMGMNMLGGMYNPMLSANSGYPMGASNLFGNGATTYLNGAQGTNNTYQYIQNLAGVSDPRLLTSGLNSYDQTLGLGTTLNNQNFWGNNGYNQYNQTPWNTNLTNGYTPYTTGTNAYPYTQNSRYTNNNWQNIQSGLNQIYEDELLETDKISFVDYYPNSAGLNSGLLGINNSMYNQYAGMQSPYMNGQYGAMMQGQYLPSVNTVQFRNNCGSDVQLEIRSMPQIQVSPNTLTLPAGQTSQVSVMSGMLPGTYTMNVLAGPTGNLNPLMTIPVNVIDYVTQTANNDCFKLSDDPVIDMSSALKRNKIIKVYNYCYSKGVIFDDAQPIALQNLFTRKEVFSNLKSKTNQATLLTDAKKKANACKRLSKEDRDKEDCYTDYRDYLDEYNTSSLLNNSNNNVPYAVATPIGVPNVENSATYGQYQVLEVMLDKDPTIQNIVSEGLTKRSGKSLSDTASLIGSLRSSLTDLYNNVEFPAIFVINARIGYGIGATQRSVQKLVTIRDLWNLAGAAGIYEGLMGNENCVPNESYRTDKSQILWKDKITTNYTHELKDSEVVDGKARLPKTSGFNLLDTVKCFGRGDSVDFSQTTYTKECGSGKVELTPHYDAGKIYFDFKAIGDVKNCSDLVFDIDYTIKSAIFTDPGYDALKQKYTFTLQYKGSTQGAKDENKKTTKNSVLTSKCIELYGNSYKSLSEYGLGSFVETNLGNMLSFKYDSKAIVDCTKTFCDAEQLKLFLNGKFTGAVQEPKYIFALNKQYAVMGDNLISLDVSKLSDPLTKFYLEKDLKNAITNGNANTFKELVANMPDLFLVTNNECTPPVNNYWFGYNKKCYYNALNLSKDANLETIIKNELKEFDVVLLVPKEKYELSSINTEFGTQGNVGNVFTVYLKADDYKTVFANDTLLGYTKDFLNEIKSSGIYYVKTSDKNAKVFNANYYLPKEVKDAIANKLYNLVIDPTRSSNYNGEFGLCVAQGKLSLDSTNTIATTENCNSKFAKAKVNESDDSLLSILGNVNDLTINNPKCDKDGCSLKTEKNTTIKSPSNSYQLKTIFENPNRYCYSENNNNLEIKYSG